MIICNMGFFSITLEINAAKRHIELKDRRRMPVVLCFGGWECLLIDRISIVVNRAKTRESAMAIPPNIAFILVYFNK